MNKPEIQLQKVKQLAEAGKFTRLIHAPYRYIYAMLLSRIIYPVTHKSSLKSAPLFFGGEMQVLLPAATDIYLTGGKTHDSETRLAQYLVAHLQEGQTFLDIGAHFGYFTLLAATLVGDKGRVVAIEPARGSFELLKDNVSGKGPIEIYNNAVSDTMEAVSFFEFPVLYSEYNTLHAEQFKDSKWIQKHPPVENKVQAVTIDSLVKENKLSPDMIKMDIEGAEIQAITGGMLTWTNTSPVIIMEYLAEKENTSYKEAVSILKTCGYRSYMIDDNGTLVFADDISSYMRTHNTTSENVVLKKDNN